MNIYDFALKMELDGEQYYFEQAAKVSHPEIKKECLLNPIRP